MEVEVDVPETSEGTPAQTPTPGTMTTVSQPLSQAVTRRNRTGAAKRKRAAAARLQLEAAHCD